MKELVKELAITLRDLEKTEVETVREGGMTFKAYIIDDIRFMFTKEGFAGMFFVTFGVEFFMTDDYRILLTGTEGNAEEDLYEADQELYTDLYKYLKMRIYFMKKFYL